MKHGIVRIGFKRSLGVDKYDLISIISTIPDDVSIVGFGEDPGSNFNFITLQGSCFKETGYGSVVPWVYAEVDSTGVFRADFSNVMKESGAADSTTLQEAMNKMKINISREYTAPIPGCVFHKWEKYVGIYQHYDYCKKCGIKKDDEIKTRGIYNGK